jgi:hypothetical protein
MTKNTSEVAPYILAIFLWSMVVNQLRQPRFEVGRVKTPIGEFTGAFPPGTASG